MDNIALSKNSRFEFTLEPVDNHRQANLSGPMDDNLKTIERRLGVEISYRGNQFITVGKEAHCDAAISLLKDLYVETAPVKGQSKPITPEMVHLAILETQVLEIGRAHV